MEKSNSRVFRLLYVAVFLALLLVGTGLTGTDWLKSTEFIASMCAALAAIACVAIFMGEKADKENRAKMRVEESLTDSLEAMKTVLNRMPVGVAIIGSDKKIRMINKAALTIIRATGADIVGEECHTAFCPAERDKCPIWDLGETIDHSERVLLDRDKNEIPILKTAQRVSLKGEDVLLEAFIDIAGQKMAEKELKESEAKFRRLVEKLPSGCFFYQHGTDGVFSYLSPSVEDTLGYTQKEFEAHYTEYLTDNPINKVVERHSELSIRGEQQPGYEVEVFHKDGSIRMLEVLEAPVRNDEGEVIFVEGIARDTTQKKLNEKHATQRMTEIETLNKGMANLLQDLREANEDLKTATGNLERTNAELESFSYSVSHDLRAPLRAIRGFAKAMVEDYGETLNEEARSFLDRILNGAEHMGELIDDLLSLSRLGRKQLQVICIDMSELVEEVVTCARSEWGDRDVEVRVDTLDSAMGDPSLIRHVWTNLIANAVKFTRPRKHALIEIGSRLEDDETVFFIGDNGVGFNSEYADELFGVFQRLHREEEFGGTGVGLAIVQRVVYRHGGRVWAEGVSGKGATFFFSLRSGVEEATQNIAVQ